MYGTFTSKHLEKIQKGLELYNNGEYWECHEELEEHWIEDPGDNGRYVYWAVLQAGAAIYHWENGKLVGACGQLAKAKEKLNKCETLKVETEVLIEKLKWREFKKAVRAMPEKPSDEQWQKLREFKF